MREGSSSDVIGTEVWDSFSLSFNSKLYSVKLSLPFRESLVSLFLFVPSSLVLHISILVGESSTFSCFSTKNMREIKGLIKSA